jgi:ABC-type lipoprotein release transport system permease subunit
MGFAAGVAVFALIAVAATVMPAMKALRIDPASTLRCE